MSVTKQANIISQNAFNQLLTNYHYPARIADLLTSNGYEPLLENIQIAPSRTSFIDFSGCQFKNVKLSGELSYSNFDNSSFYNVEFSKAKMDASFFGHVTMENSKSTDSSFKDTVISNSTFRNDSFNHCDFTNAYISHSSLNKNIFSKAVFNNVYESHNTASDLHVVFNQPYQNENVFKNAQTHLIKPTIAIVDDAEWHGTPFYKLSEYGAIPKTIDQHNYMVNDFELKMEVQKVFNEIHLFGLSDNSIAEQVINSGQPIIQSIKDQAYKIMSESDAVWIPGGPDLHTEFYNETTNQAYPPHSYYREVLEFSLTQAAIAMDKPILGICHGSQLVNVFLGGSLHQHVDTPSGHVDLIAHTNEGLIGSVIENQLIGPSYHHQAVKRIADTLEVVASYNGVIKATQATDGKKIMLCQFHPEYEADKSSVNILNQFINLSSENKIQSTVLKLADVIDMNSEVIGMLPIPAVESNLSQSACVSQPCITQHLPILPHPLPEMMFS